MVVLKGAVKLFFNILILLTLSTNLFGQTKIKSFYFFTNKSKPTIYSQKQFDEFNRSINMGMAKIIEINAFTDSTGTVTSNDTLAAERLDYFTSRLTNTSGIKMNAYALERPYPLPSALNWRRVDIIYDITLGNETNDITSSEDGKAKVEHNEIDSIALKVLLKDPIVEVKQNLVDEASYTNSLKSEKPFVLDIQFIEGTAKMTAGSDKEIKKLIEFLKENPGIHATIRGHVCCGNNMRISKARAKDVYKSVINGGIERSRISFVGKSNLEPLVFPEKTSQDRQMNRRVDVKFDLP